MTKTIKSTAKKEGEFSRYKHLGKAGSAEHISSVLAVVRRVQIEELTKAIDGLKESWSDLYSDEKKWEIELTNNQTKNTGLIYAIIRHIHKTEKKF